MFVLGRSWNINCTTMQKIGWGIVDMFIDRETSKKITFHRETNPKELVEAFHPSQLEKRFGGAAERPK